MLLFCEILLLEIFVNGDCEFIVKIDQVSWIQTSGCPNKLFLTPRKTNKSKCVQQNDSTGMIKYINDILLQILFIFLLNRHFGRHVKSCLIDQ